MRNTIYWIDGNWPGRLAIVPRPRGNDWLEDEVVAWQQAGLDVIVSLLEKDEADELGLRQEAALCEAAGIEFVSFPIVDRSVPVMRQAAMELAARLAQQLRQGRNIGIHCRQSVGRASLLAASVMMALGVNPEDALRKISEARGCPVPETAQQYEWLMAFALPQAA
jgi:protein-tyrosine phosphatase